jgi:hypothetical protein
VGGRVLSAQGARDSCGCGCSHRHQWRRGGGGGSSSSSAAASGRAGERAGGGAGERASGRAGERASGRAGERGSGGAGRAVPCPPPSSPRSDLRAGHMRHHSLLAERLLERALGPVRLLEDGGLPLHPHAGEEDRLRTLHRHVALNHRWRVAHRRRVAQRRKVAQRRGVGRRQVGRLGDIIAVDLLLP